jgi:hypothetical protein
VADVEQVGGVVSEPALSLFTKPEYEGVMVGAALPYVAEAEDAAMLSGAGSTSTDPLT